MIHWNDEQVTRTYLEFPNDSSLSSTCDWWGQSNRAQRHCPLHHCHHLVSWWSPQSCLVQNCLGSGSCTCSGHSAAAVQWQTPYIIFHAAHMDLLYSISPMTPRHLIGITDTWWALDSIVDGWCSLVLGTMCLAGCQQFLGAVLSDNRLVAQTVAQEWVYQAWVSSSLLISDCGSTLHSIYGWCIQLSQPFTEAEQVGGCMPSLLVGFSTSLPGFWPLICVLEHHWQCS